MSMTKAQKAAKAEADAKTEAEAKAAAAEAEAKAKAEADAKAGTEAKAAAAGDGADDGKTPVDGAKDGSQGGPPAPDPVGPTGLFRYEVAPGKSITCARGNLGPGEEVLVKHFARNADATEAAQESLDKLVAGGYVVDNEAQEEDAGA